MTSIRMPTQSVTNSVFRGLFKMYRGLSEIEINNS
jgi:hypothetical protein